MASYLFLTGELATPSLRTVLEEMDAPFDHAVHTMPITVAALAECGWIARHLPETSGYDLIVVPGLCQGDLAVVQESAGAVEVQRGSDHLKDLPAYFDLEAGTPALDAYDINILAEIVDAHLLSKEQLLETARRYRNQGADIIDLGGPVSGSFPGVGNAVRLLAGEGFRVSVDTFDVPSLREAARAGAELLLSVNSKNIEGVLDLDCRVAVIPDFNDKSLDSLEKNIDLLEIHEIPYIADPVLDPFPFGLAESIERFIAFRRRRPETPMLMGIGNQTELMEADSSGVNAMLAALCSDLSIGAVLTTSVVSWATGAVSEFDRARRLMFYAKSTQSLPKHASAGLVVARSLPHQVFSVKELESMQGAVRDLNFRIFVSHPKIYVFNGDVFVSGETAGEIWEQIDIEDPGHAFYLGRELQKAETALVLKKRYGQDQPLEWGYVSESP
ncbi:MAG: DUF6513 domain-containing protein [Synergistota bacterium]|nr:DUF6513 domain-containing protein [Synergistota bacterium]